MKKPAPQPTQECPSCFICERIGGPMLYIPYRGHRHDSTDCAPGGCNWVEYYDRPGAIHTDAGDIIRRHCKQPVEV